ncbi:MAG TPA: hypothetical protein VGC21_17385 [Telluria sp.]
MTTIHNLELHKYPSTGHKAIERMLFKWEVPLPTEAHAVHYWAQG